MADDDKHDKYGTTCSLDGQDIAVRLPGSNACVRHTKDHQFVMGFIVELRDGQTAPGDALAVEEISPGMYKVGPSMAELKAGSGPAQVATPAYRDNYERTFGKSKFDIN